MKQFCFLRLQRTFYSLAIIYFSFFAPVLCYGGTDERILFFHSDIKVHKDSSLTVTETIKVRSTGSQIKHGIYRDFPTKYKDRFGNNYVVGFDVLEILRDGNSEAYYFKELSNGKRVYIGKKDVFLSTGEYTYTIVYNTNRQLGFFEDHDELYWNVTGNGWVFPIDEAGATVDLPLEIPKDNISVAAYTGPKGSKNKDFNTSADDFGNIVFTTTKPLNSYEGLTIVVSWPKGFITEPTIKIKLQYFIKDNLSLIFGIIGIVIILIYYIFIWFIVGKDPAKGTIIPLYNSPRNLSPAVIRYITKMGYDNKVFSSAIINMAVKGFLSISEKDGVYTIIKNKPDETVLTPEEKKIANKLLGSSNKIELKPENHSRIRSSIESVKNLLKISFEKTYFFTNRQYFLTGLILSIIALAISGILEPIRKGDFNNIPTFVFMSLWLTIWGIGVIFLLLHVINSWKEVIFGRKKLMLVKAIFLSIFSIPFVFGTIFGLNIFASITSKLMIGILVIMVFINYAFYHLLKAPTLLGRKILDQIEGFKMFLTTTEKDRINFFSPVGGKTIKLFEKYLPYAIALDIEKEWSEQFSDILSSTAETGTQYTPCWYSGPAWYTLGISNFASSLGSSLSSTISSSSTPPGSSSGGGGGGGGSSGGGGGGGGGGGW